MPPKQQRVLPSKEATLFKELLSLYEARQLKKALKVSDQILKKVGEHGGQFIRHFACRGFITFYRDCLHEGSGINPHGKKRRRH